MIKLYVLLFLIKGWDNSFVGERMSTPLVSYILLGVILLVVSMRVLTWLQFRHLRRQAEKRIFEKKKIKDKTTRLPAKRIKRR